MHNSMQYDRVMLSLSADNRRVRASCHDPRQPGAAPERTRPEARPGWEFLGGACGATTGLDRWAPRRRSGSSPASARAGGYRYARSGTFAAMEGAAKTWSACARGWRGSG
jgi:hypothetical protein